MKHQKEEIFTSQLYLVVDLSYTATTTMELAGMGRHLLEPNQLMSKVKLHLQ